MKKGLTVRWFTACCLLLFLFSCARDTSTPFSQGKEKIRIAVLKGARDLKIGGVGITAAGTEFNKENTALVVLEEEDILTINGKKIPDSSVIFSSENGILYLNGRPFRGKIEVIKDQRGFLVVNELPLEFYIAGLINHEISSKWPIEAVKTQAVIARTYALYQKKKKGAATYHMESTVIDQVYSGSIAEDDRSIHAVKETIGEVLTYNGELALTVYHSNGGGATEDSKNVWGKDYPYLRQVKSPFDKDSPNFSWMLNISMGSVETALKGAGYQAADVKDIIPLSRTNSGRITRLRILHGKGELEVSGEDLRKAIGYDKLKSAMFTAEMADGLFVFNGKGSGHGVGLSQWGAKGMAQEGYSYTEILKHFYPGTSLERIY
ncbi:MAG TPA: SpoIID/LytB domain-containing protein [Thermodesulfobacteriota bacterium]|nr:SpoIID/LytB domain-containing protein [Thermodesulfobacteriota bacterium]